MPKYWKKYMLNSQHNYVLSDGYAFDLSELTIVFPVLRERWAFKREKKNLAPNLVPSFYWRDQRLTNLYRGHDYTISFSLGRGKHESEKTRRKLKSVEHAGDYCATVMGQSAHLKGKAFVTFTVRRRSLAPVVLIAVALAAVVVIVLALLGYLPHGL